MAAPVPSNEQSASLSGETPAIEPSFLDDVLAGLSAPQRFLPSKYFYDETGSRLFDEICELDEYYLTRCETAIMQRFAQPIAAQVGTDVRLVELGSGSSTKTRVLLDCLVDPASYIPVDISGEHLRRVTDELAQEYPLVDMEPLIGDFTQPLELPVVQQQGTRTCLYFPGSTIGNFAQRQSRRLLSLMRDMVEPDDGLLVGIDLQKDVDRLIAAYDDARGVTAEFNKNILRHINRELGGDFELKQFAHMAVYNDDENRIEMRLQSRCAQTVTVAGHEFSFAAGESILTEYSHKYTVDGFAAMAADASWELQHTWTDPRDFFAVLYFKAC